MVARLEGRLRRSVVRAGVVVRVTPLTSCRGRVRQWGFLDECSEGGWVDGWL